MKFCHTLNDRVFLLKLIPGISGRILEALYDTYDAVIIEAFGVGGLPNYGDDSFYEMIQKFISSGKIVIMATQVTHEGSDMEIYQVGKVMKDQFNLIESYDMTLHLDIKAVVSMNIEVTRFFLSTVHSLIRKFRFQQVMFWIIRSSFGL